MNSGRLVVNWHSAESAVGKSKSFNVDHPLSESTIENRESHITDRMGEIQVSKPGRAGP